VRFLPAVLLLVAVLAAAAPSRPLDGRVIDGATGSPVSGADIVVCETGFRLASDTRGRFSLPSLLPGRYTLTVRRFGYAQAERAVIVGPGAEESVVISLSSSVFPSEEIVIRSTRAAAGTDSRTAPVGLFLQEELARGASATLPDALASVPGVSLVRDGSWETALSIRGMGRTNLVALVDNVRIETAQDIAGALSLVNPLDLERVEVIKTPGSVLYGTGSLGGVVHAVTRRPGFSEESRAGGEAAAEYGGVNGVVAQYAAATWETPRFGIRLSGGARHAGNTMTPAGVLENSAFRDFSFSATAALATFGDQSLLLSYQRVQAEDTGIPGGAPISPAAKATYTLARREMAALEYTIPNPSPAWPRWTIRLSRQEIDRNVDIVQNPTLRLTPHATHVTYTGGVEGTADPGGGHALAFGVEVWERSLESRRERIDTRLGLVTGERPVPSSTYLSAGGFVQDTWEILPEHLTAYAGGRYDLIRVRNDEVWNPDYVTGLDGTMRFTAASSRIWEKGEAHDVSWSASGGMRYAASKDVECSLLLATAFRSPSLEERFQYIDLGNLVRVGNPGLLPERGVTVNAGAVFRPDGNRIRCDLYLTTLSNLVVELPGTWEGRNALIKQNIGAARIYGVELSGEHPLGSAAAFRWSLASCRGEDTYAHHPLPQIPPVSGMLGCRLAAEGMGSVDLAASFAYDQTLVGAGELSTPGYVVADLGIAADPIVFGRAGILLRGGIRNLLDQPYRNHLSTLRGIVRDEPGRDIHLSATITF
jgi:hemoglobin/transferrin/lactoferrin receptor protein